MHADRRAREDRRPLSRDAPVEPVLVPLFEGLETAHLRLDAGVKGPLVGLRSEVEARVVRRTHLSAWIRRDPLRGAGDWRATAATAPALTSAPQPG
jgi:hypothetical protein